VKKELTMYCSKCGALNAESSAYCYSCGNALTHEEKSHRALASSVTSNTEDVSELAMPQPESITTNEQEGTSNVGRTSYDKNTSKRMPEALRVALALLACFGVYVVYVIIGVSLGWKRGGGIIPLMIMFAIMGYVWRAITGTGRKKD
jgi:hypothetical protein